MRRHCPIASLLSVLSTCWLAAGPASPLTAAVPPRGPGATAAAMVCLLHGDVTVQAPGSTAQPATLFERLPAGAVVRCGPHSAATLVFFDGSRYAVGSTTSAIVQPAGVRAASGEVRHLPQVAQLVAIAPLAWDDSLRKRAAAIRIRAAAPPPAAITGLSPRDGATVLADALALTFTPAPGIEAYRVEIMFDDSHVVFSADTHGPTVNVPRGALKAGGVYGWEVRALDSGADDRRGNAVFVTLGEKETRQRHDLAVAASRSRQADLELALAAIDHQAGLASEACAELRAAAAWIGAGGDPQGRREPAAADAGEPYLRQALASFGCAAAAVSTGSPADPGTPGGAEPGLTVEGAEKGSAAEQAGLRPGDVLLAWTRAASAAGPQPAAGRFSSPFEIDRVATEEAPRGVVSLSGMRSGQAMTWVMPDGDWQLTAAPRLAPPLLADYEEGTRQIAAGDVAQGLARWRAIAARWEAAGDPELAAWLLLKGGERMVHNRAADEAAAAAAWDAARGLYGEALAIAEGHCPAIVTSLVEGLVAEAHARHGETRQAAELFRRAITTRGKVEEDGLFAARELSWLGHMSAVDGDFPAAEKWLARAVAIDERLVPGSLPVAKTINNLGIVKSYLGDLVGGEQCYRRSLEIDRVLVPDSLDLALDFVNLANLAARRMDLNAAEDYGRRALAIQERLAPDSEGMAASLHNLGIVFHQEADYARAAEYFGRSLAMSEKLDPNGMAAIDSLHGLASTAAVRKDWRLAEGYFRRLLEIAEKQSPSSFRAALARSDLGAMLTERGRLAEAEALELRAVADVSHQVPGTTDEAEVYAQLAVTERRLHHLAAATAASAKALATIESQAEQLGGADDARTAFAAKYAEYYKERLGLLIELGRPVEAFHLLERYRARGFLAMLAERDLEFALDAPAELEHERRRLHADYDRTEAQLAAAANDGSAPARERTEKLRRHLGELVHERHEVQAKLRAASPRLAALRYPQPLDLEGTRQVLDPGTLLLSYSIGKQESYLFAVGPGSHDFTVRRLAVDEERLSDEVRRFRAAVEQSHETAGRELVTRLAAQLGNELLVPAADQIARADRLLVIPDGALHFLPFAALASPAANKAAGQAAARTSAARTSAAGPATRFLIEDKPLAIAASATVFAELKKRRRLPAEVQEAHLVAFGDPAYPAAAPGGAKSAEPVLRAALRSGLSLEPLPGTRAEVENLRAIYPHSRILVGAEATEENAKALGKQASILHFACHGILDERSPLDSALALTIPDKPGEGQDNGLLQAWEIFEQVRLDADLVTLSACQSAMGKELSGEGLMGLTRAFQYAGARTVLASLWNISDSSTAELMKRFYGYLRAGQTKDDALRHAQLDLLHGAANTSGGDPGSSPPLDASHPFYWAAFELLGDRQ
jgi:CHAT domain-containing protein